MKFYLLTYRYAGYKTVEWVTRVINYSPAQWMVGVLSYSGTYAIIHSEEITEEEYNLLKKRIG